MQQNRLDALLIGDDPFFGGHGPQLIGLATRYRLPTIYPYRAHVVLGGLLSYGASIASMYRLAGEYTPAYSMAQNRATYRSSNRPNSIWSSI
jgi:putative ABC transport system substrate-binding protein